MDATRVGLRLLHYSDLEGAFDDPERIGRLSGLLRARTGPDTVVAGSGDNTAPGVVSLFEAGRQAIPFFERVGAHVDTIGNHDLDYGLDAARALIADSPQTWLNANLDRNGSRFGADAGTTPWTIVEPDGTRVGITGVTTPNVPDITPPAAGLTVDDPITAARAAVTELRERAVDAVVVLAHLHDDEAIARELDVDAVLSGHAHERRVTTVDGVPVSRTGAGGEVVHELDLQGSPSVRAHRVADAPLDAELATALRERIGAAGLDEPVATVETPIERSSGTDLAPESEVGNLVADAYRHHADADVGLQNHGGLRAGPALSGTVTVGDLIGLAPFEEPVVVAELTGTELRSVLREGSGGVGEVGTSGEWDAHCSGVELVWDHATRSFESLSVGDAPLDPAGTYELAAPEYLLKTDLEYPTLTEAHRARTLSIQYDAIVEYAREAGIEPAIEGRVVFA